MDDQHIQVCPPSPPSTIAYARPTFSDDLLIVEWSKAYGPDFYEMKRREIFATPSPAKW
jgi:hypothetical protein